MGWLDGTTTNVTRAQDLADAISLSWQGEFLNDLVDDYVFTGVTVIGIDNPTVTAFNSDTATGASTQQPLPQFVVANVALTTGLRGRSYNGRFGIPGMSVADSDSANGNQLNSTAVAVLQGNVSSFIAGLEGAGINRKLAVVSTISGGTPRPTPIATAVTTAQVKTPFGSRVSRKG